MPMTLEKALEVGKELSNKEPTFLIEDSLGNFKVIQKSYLEIGDVTSYSIINQEIIKERQYTTPVGLCHSVTEILKQTKTQKDIDSLNKWKKRMDKTNGEGSANKFSSEAKARGTNIHLQIENYLKEKDYCVEDDLFFQILPLLKSLKNKWVSIEKFTFAEGYAGKFDLLANFEEKLTIFDWKTSQKPKRKQWMADAFIQTTAYALAESERRNEPIKQIAVGVISPNNFQLFVEDVANYKDEWQTRLNQFKQLKSI